MEIQVYSAFPKAPVLPADFLVSYPRHSLGESYHSEEMKSVYSADPADKAIIIRILMLALKQISAKPSEK